MVRWDKWIVRRPALTPPSREAFTIPLARTSPCRRQLFGINELPIPNFFSSSLSGATYDQARGRVPTKLMNGFLDRET
jgi:hypothetical protein